ncbi:hypothetical protein [Nocardiopsis sp. ATB16-24]|uniref:hypothetical protein n=1 Tax=Nocardiopsis sp. ATB16-24 TaxID=3019555 RepID=UPI0025527089|nr:hypothetical protein [Nocardiopsis sp. ATB16-24]
MILSILATVAVLAAIAVITAALLLAETVLVYIALGLAGASVLLLLGAFVQDRFGGGDPDRTGGLGKASVQVAAFSGVEAPAGAHVAPEHSGRAPVPVPGPVREASESEPPLWPTSEGEDSGHEDPEYEVPRWQTPTARDWPEPDTAETGPTVEGSRWRTPAEDGRPTQAQASEEQDDLADGEVSDGFVPRPADDERTQETPEPFHGSSGSSSDETEDHVDVEGRDGDARSEEDESPLDHDAPGSSDDIDGEPVEDGADPVTEKTPEAQDPPPRSEDEDVEKDRNGDDTGTFENIASDDTSVESGTAEEEPEPEASSPGGVDEAEEDVDASVGEEEEARSFAYRIPGRPSEEEDEGGVDAPDVSEGPLVSEDEVSRDEGGAEDGHEGPRERGDGGEETSEDTEDPRKDHGEQSSDPDVTAVFAYRIPGREEREDGPEEDPDAEETAEFVREERQDTARPAEEEPVAAYAAAVDRDEETDEKR